MALQGSRRSERTDVTPHRESPRKLVFAVPKLYRVCSSEAMYDPAAYGYTDADAPRTVFRYPANESEAEAQEQLEAARRMYPERTHWVQEIELDEPRA